MTLRGTTKLNWKNLLTDPDIDVFREEVLKLDSHENLENPFLDMNKLSKYLKFSIDIRDINWEKDQKDTYRGDFRACKISDFT